MACRVEPVGHARIGKRNHRAEFPVARKRRHRAVGARASIDIFKRVEERIVQLHVPVGRVFRDFRLDDKRLVVGELEDRGPVGLLDQRAGHAHRLEHVEAHAFLHRVLQAEIHARLARGKLRHLLDPRVDIFGRRPRLGRHRIEAFDRQHGIDLVVPVVHPVTREHPARLGIDRCPVALVAVGPLRAEQDLEILARNDAEVVGVDFVVAGRLRHFVDRSRQRLLRGERQDLASAAISRNAVREIAADRRLDVDIVGIGLKRVDRVPQRRPVGMLRRGVEIHEIGIGQARHRLAVDIRAVGRILRPPGLREIVDRTLKVTQAMQQRRMGVVGHHAHRLWDRVRMASRPGGIAACRIAPCRGCRSA